MKNQMKRLLQHILALSLILAVLMSIHTEARATLISSYQFNGTGNWSIDGVGSNNSPVGTLDAFVPVGATVEKAFLYSSTWNFTSPIVPSVNFNGTTYSGADWVSLGILFPNPVSFPSFSLQAFRVDVTSQVAAGVGLGSATPFSFNIQSETPNDRIDGEVLAIVYSLPTESVRTIAFLDGFSTSGGDTTTINFANPLTAAQLADPNFQAELSLGIGFSAGGSQFSTVDVNVAGNHLSSSAGGFDDGFLANGGLITVGGLGDNLANPSDPNSSTSPDDELYTLSSFLSVGQSQFSIFTSNPSLDDNIFFAGLNITAVAGVNQPAPPTATVPDGGSTLALLGMSVGTIGFLRRRFVG